MKMLLNILVFTMVMQFAVALANAADAAERRYGAPPHDIAQKLDALVAAYPDHLESHNGHEVVWRDGTRMPVSDGRTDKTFDELLNAPDIDDMFAFPYPAGAEPAAPGFEHDPGRIRYEPFFKKMYGDCKSGARVPAARVAWLRKHGGGALRVTTVNGVDKALSAVSADLERLGESFAKFLVPSAGTYNCRVIAGTRRLSVHAFAAAVDVNVKYAHYWKWTKPDGRGFVMYGTTGSPRPSSTRSSATASFGAAIGITTTPCISSTARNCWRRSNRPHAARQRKSLQRFEIRYVHVRSATNNCFQCAIERDRG